MKRSILHMLDPTPNNSPFDINMALDAGFDVLMPYSNVKLEDVHALTQDAIFSRGPGGVKRTAIFIGGRNLGLAIDMLNASKLAMVPPFAVSVFADPSGAFTTAASLVACVEKLLAEHFEHPLQGANAVVFGGTGPVGVATGVILALAGAQTTLVDHLSLETASDEAKQYNRRFKCQLQPAVASNDEQKNALIKDADIIFCTAKAGVRVLTETNLQCAERLKVVGDVNAVPPSGIEGVSTSDMGTPLSSLSTQKVLSVGALAIGNVKYQVQHALLASMLQTDKPVYLDFRNAFYTAQEYLKNKAS